ncbi:Protease Do-like 7 [Vitis vinifera]|uniref:Protease Do-like 7 n=1 Tax=Vitis vinifera TaxID=29760 RepID=A0A438EAY8_VITVI|nr:Protease Do-like 7 [Vitis vinifera]
MGDPLERLGSEEVIRMESCMKEELYMEIDPPFQENVTTAKDWKKALNTVVPMVVLRTTTCRAFDTEAVGASYALGPVIAEAMFVNREEIPVYSIYRDPVHPVLMVIGLILLNGEDWFDGDVLACFSLLYASEQTNACLLSTCCTENLS